MSRRQFQPDWSVLLPFLIDLLWRNHYGTTMDDGRQRWIVLVDFDGTITIRDADLEIADAVLGQEAEKKIGPLIEAYEKLELSCGEYFKQYLALIGIPVEDFSRYAVRVPARQGFDKLVSWAKTKNFSVKVVSEGLDIWIMPILRAMGLDDVPVSCNHIVSSENSYEVIPPDDSEPCDRCLNCKRYHVNQAKDRGLAVALVGNGASDLCAARHADLVMAKDSLIDHCKRENIDFMPWETFDDVIDALEGVLCRRWPTSFLSEP